MKTLKQNDAKSSILSTEQAFYQLRWVWPRLTQSNAEEIREAIRQITPDWVKEFKKEHPHAKNAVIYRVNKHEIMIRDLDSNQPSVHWIDHPKLLGRAHTWGCYAKLVEEMRSTSGFAEKPPKLSRV